MTETVMDDLIKETLETHKDKFCDEFVSWLPDNQHVWEAFTDEAIKIQQKGYKHYSATVSYTHLTLPTKRIV